MADVLSDDEPDDDPEPADRSPAGPLYVPVRPGPAACAARLFRTPLGGRTAVGFTSPGRLAATLGSEQPWIRLCESALRALAAPLGVTTVTVDPQFCAPAPAAPPPSARWYGPGPRTAARDDPTAAAPPAGGTAAPAGAPALRIG
ncbi:hypothetical protein SZN_26611 [Streptomyces zinciresistens K42]|uniref:SseB protein N-terminal domain-containing protein n=1 Tax=Streptomyces zinciresistens K42 TaxID=700597 RepID=G2GII2_9ACTN|nr:SAV_915 family protein [Streptomyces zinciresistens]EGX56673.1 hypothetical protein SZN_26611 [Streptomyces zinciresistens K42]